mmetsp:Transcript_18887/g.59365  ORF Transcript_18887/g.59365 Transcript_18887/m.59365 type:complete len:232 (-) Transcript_18887:960-1655(-)
MRERNMRSTHMPESGAVWGMGASCVRRRASQFSASVNTPTKRNSNCTRWKLASTHSSAASVPRPRSRALLRELATVTAKSTTQVLHTRRCTCKSAPSLHIRKSLGPRVLKTKTQKAAIPHVTFAPCTSSSRKASPNACRAKCSGNHFQNAHCCHGSHSLDHLEQEGWFSAPQTKDTSMTLKVTRVAYWIPTLPLYHSTTARKCSAVPEKNTYGMRCRQAATQAAGEPATLA